MKNIFSNPIKVLSVHERLLWLLSVVAVVASNIFIGKVDVLTLVAVIIGVTSLIFAAKGHIIAQVLMIIFSVLYAIISYRFCYWGEMITYLGMVLPMAVWAFISWYRNPSDENSAEVKIRIIKLKHIVISIVGCAIVTTLFYYLLRMLNTPNIVLSTVSIATSFFAAALLALRSSYYGLAYALNDLVLIMMWILASIEDVSYIPVVVNFVVFLFNDIYGFVSWKRRERRQSV